MWRKQSDVQAQARPAENRKRLLRNGTVSILLVVLILVANARPGEPARLAAAGAAHVHRAALFDTSAPLASLHSSGEPASPVCSRASAGCGASPATEDEVWHRRSPHRTAEIRGKPANATTVPPTAMQSVEQTSQGPRPPALLLESFDGHGFGTAGPHGSMTGNNPSDNSLAVGPNHIVETVNSRMAVYTKKGERFDSSGRALFGPMPTNVLFSGFGGECERAPNGDAVVRYDQLAERWLYVMPLFRRAQTAPGAPEGKYGMCYAVSAGPNPLGPYHRYYFERELFPDYPRPAIWPDGYYIPTSTGDDVIEKHACVVDRSRMLQGLPATEQCVTIPDVNFLNNADIEGWGVPPAGAPNIMIATGGTQLRSNFEDDGIYVWKFHVDWSNPANTRVTGPQKISVAPYHYLCDGQLTRCVSQPGTETRLDAQGDKIMHRPVYRNIDGRESIVAVHSVNTAAGGGGVRWYEFRLDADRDLVLHQQGTYAPDGFYRWLASPGMDRKGNIGIGYSFGGAPHYPGQRFAARLADDPPGALTFRETVLVEGQGSQSPAFRWEDYTALVMDPVDDCTFWYVGDYLKTGAPSYTTRIGAFRLPGCLEARVSGTAWFDRNHNGVRDPNEPGLSGWSIEYRGTARALAGVEPPSGRVRTDSIGDYRIMLPADPAYFDPVYNLTSRAPANPAWSAVTNSVAYAGSGPLRMSERAYSIRLVNRDDVTHASFGYSCTVSNTGGATAQYWLSERGRALLAANDQQPLEPGARGARGGRGGARGFGPGGANNGWRNLLNLTTWLVNPDGSRLRIPAGGFDVAYAAFRTWAGPSNGNPAHEASLRLAAAALNVAWGEQNANVTVNDAVSNDWPALGALLARVSEFIAAHPNPSGEDRRTAERYRDLLDALNANRQAVTPASPDACPAPF